MLEGKVPHVTAQGLVPLWCRNPIAEFFSCSPGTRMVALAWYILIHEEILVCGQQGGSRRGLQS